MRRKQERPAARDFWGLQTVFVELLPCIEFDPFGPAQSSTLTAPIASAVRNVKEMGSVTLDVMLLAFPEQYRGFGWKAAYDESLAEFLRRVVLGEESESC